MASIKAQGLLQNLIVIPKGKTKYEVVAGGRRLAALQALAANEEIEKNVPVPVSVKAKDADITEISLAENTQRAGMHPADQFVAYAKLEKEGLGAGEIAARFGVSKKTVEKRLVLGKVAPEIMDDYRKEKNNLTLDCMAAFTVCSDHERQIACYKALKGSSLYSHAIKNWLLGESVVAERGIGRFVTKAVYVRRGGAISSDLFSDCVYLSDAALVTELANEKLEMEAQKIKSESNWSWVKTSLDGHSAGNGFVCLQPELVGVPDELTQQIEALDKKCGALWDELAEKDWPEDLEAKHDALSDELTKLESARDDKYLKYTDEQKSYSGCVVTFSNDGGLLIHEGLADKKDIPQTKPASSNGDSEPAEAASDSSISQALRADFGQYRQQIMQASLLGSPDVAMDVLHFSLCCQLLDNDYFFAGRELTSAQFSAVDNETSLGDSAQGRGYSELADAKSKLNTEWLAIEDSGERFKAFCALPKKQKTDLITYCVATTLKAGVRHPGEATVHHALIDALQIPFAGYWSPTKENCFSRMKKNVLLDRFSELNGDEWAEKHAESSKKQIVQELSEQFAGEDAPEWVPAEF